MMLTRKNDVPISLDAAVLRQQSKDNPVFYVNYALARINSTFGKVPEVMGQDFHARYQASVRDEIDLSALNGEAEINLIRTLVLWPTTLETAANNCEPHRIAYYLIELASGFHSLWSAGKGDEQMRFLLTNEPEVTTARLALLEACAKVLNSGFDVMGVTAQESM